MAQSNDVLAQMLLQQSRQQGRRQSAASRLAEQMMAGLNNPTPVYSTGATLARAGSGLLAGLMAQQAESRDQAREDEQMQRLQDRTDKRDYTNRQELASFLGGPSQAPIQMPQPIQTAPEGTVLREPLGPLPQVQPRGEAPLAVSQGIAQRAALDPNAPDYAERIAQINNGVMGQTMPGQAPQPVPRSAQTGAGAPPQSDAMTMYLRAVSSQNPMISRLAPGYLAQANREDARAGRVNPTVEINGPQGPGTYERRPDGTLAFIGARMPPQEGAETFTGAPQTVMQNGQPVLVQMGNRGPVRPIQGYGPNPQQPDDNERLLRASGYQPGTPEYEAQARILLQRRGQPAQTNINTGDSPQAILARSDVETIKSQNAAANQARVLLPLFDRVEEAIRNVPEGAGAQFAPILGQVASAFGVPINGTSEAEVFRALTATLAPLQRVEGSGATSDRDIGLYLQAVPRLGNTREGNLALVDMGRRAAGRRIEEATIWRQYAGTPDVMDRLNALPPLWSDEERAMLRPPRATSGQPVAPPRPPGMIDRARRNAPGTPALPPGFEVLP
jgi:hypothetical protein